MKIYFVFSIGVVNTTESGKLSKFNTTFTSLAYANGASGLEEIRKTNISEPGNFIEILFLLS